MLTLWSVLEEIVFRGLLQPALARAFERRRLPMGGSPLTLANVVTSVALRRFPPLAPPARGGARRISDLADLRQGARAERPLVAGRAAPRGLQRRRCTRRRGCSPAAARAGQQALGIAGRHRPGGRGRHPPDLAVPLLDRDRGQPAATAGAADAVAAARLVGGAMDRAEDELTCRCRETSPGCQSSSVGTWTQRFR